MKTRRDNCIFYFLSALFVYIFYFLSALFVLLTAQTAMSIAQHDAISVKVDIYTAEPQKLLGVQRLKQEVSISAVKFFDLSIIPRMEAMFGKHAHATMQRQSIAAIKNLVARLPRRQLHDLAIAQMDFFELQIRYDVVFDDLPLIVFRHGEKSYLYQGNDVYQGFLLWQRLRK